MLKTCPSYQGRQDVSPLYPFARRKARTTRDDLPDMAPIPSTSPIGSDTERGGSLIEKEVRFDLDHEEGRTHRSGTDGVGHESGEGDVRDDDGLAGKDSGESRTAKRHRRSIRRHPERSGEDESDGADDGDERTFVNDRCKDDASQDDRGNSRRCGRAEVYQLRSGSDHSADEGSFADSWWPEGGILRPHSDGDKCGGLDNGRKYGASSEALPIPETKVKSLFQWAANVVAMTGCDRRSRVLVNRVMTVDVKQPLIASSDIFHKSTNDLESWTEINHSTTHFDNTIFKGLDQPVWRRTTNIQSGELIESRPYDESMLSTTTLPTGVTDIQSEVWHGTRLKKRDPSSKAKRHRCIMKGVRQATAVFLLEAMVLLATGSEWAGSWTQYCYGTGTADVWEVFGSHSELSKAAFKQGWRTLEPLNVMQFKNSTVQEYVDTTVDERNPRLVAIETPNKLWRINFSEFNDTSKNSNRQKAKKSRGDVHVFLENACNVAEKQLGQSKDFIMEIPHALSNYPNERLHALLRQSNVSSHAGKSCLNAYWDRGSCRAVWWISSSETIANKLNHSSRNPSTAYAILGGFTEHLKNKNPERLVCLLRSLDARIRGAGMFAEDVMLTLRDDILHDSRVYSIIDEHSEIPEDGIEFDLDPVKHKKSRSRYWQVVVGCTSIVVILLTLNLHV